MKEREKSIASVLLAALAIVSMTILGGLGKIDGQAVVAVVVAALGIVGVYHAPAPGQSAVPPAAAWLLVPMLGLGAAHALPSARASAMHTTSTTRSTSP